MIKICYYASNIGNIRSNNEDCFQINKFVGSKINKKGFKILKKKNLISVCDGMGGEEYGEVASLIASVELARTSNHNLEKENMLSTISTINNLVCQEIEKRETRLGSTMVSAVINKNKVDIYNVGDSRAYIFNKKLIQISKDHSSKNGALTQHLGISLNEMEIEPFVIDEIELSKKNYLLLCSDGLYNMVSEKEIESVLKSDLSDFKKRDKLLNIALKNGGKDNITFLLVKCY